MGSKRKSGFHNEAQDARTELQPLALNYAASRSALLVRSSSCFETTIESCHRQVPIPVLSNSFRSANQSLISEILRRNARNPWLEGVMHSLLHPNLFVRTVILLSAGHRRFAISFSAHLGPVL
jgi:hypothetical protein